MSDKSKVASNISTPEALGIALFGFVTITFFGGFIIMLMNVVFNWAWPNVQAFRPGIGFRQATILFGLILVYRISFGFKVMAGKKQ